MSPRKQRRRFDLRITPGALVVIGLELGLSLVYLLLDAGTKGMFERNVAASADGLLHHYRVWTIVTTVFFEPKFFSLLLHAVVMWAFVPTLERFWGTPRFYRFFAITSLAGVVGGVLVGVAIGQWDVPISGLDPFIWGTIVAFGIVYAKQPVQLFGALPLTGRQMMYGFLAFVALMVVLEQQWAAGASYAAGMLAAAALTAKRGSPVFAWRRWRVKRARAKLTVLEGGRPSPRPRDEQKWLN